MRRLLTPWLAGAVVLFALLGFASILAQRGLTNALHGPQRQAAAARGFSPEQRCTSARTYDSIKLELFRTASQTRGGDRAAFDRISAYSIVRMERPLLTGFDEDLGTTRCSGRLSLDLPPGLAVVGGRRSLAADIDYVVQPAADGSGDVVAIEGGGPIMVPLATLAQSGDARLASNAIRPAVTSEPVYQPVPSTPEIRRPQPNVRLREVPARVSPPADRPSVRTVQKSPAPPRRAETLPVGRVEATPVRRAEVKKSTVRKATPAALPAQVKDAKARPSFNCRYARTGGEKAICGNAPLASLDRQMASQYYRAVASADARKRQRLASTRNDFLRRRDKCSSEACIAASYRERMREIERVGSQ